MRKLKLFSLFLCLFVGLGQMWGTVSTWTLVESEPSDWSGEYLIVYGTKCFNGSLSSSLDQHQGVDVTINNNSISLDDSYAMIVAKSGNKYSLQTTEGCYVGRNANSNGMDAGTTWSTNYTVSFGSWNETNKTIKITGNGGRALGNNSGPWRFYASSNAYTNLKLFRKSGGTTEPTGSMTPDPTSVDVTAEGDDNGSISITYDGITDKTNVEDVKIYSDAEHTVEVTNTIDWLIAVWNADKTAVEYEVAANTGAERTAYIYLHALDDEANSVEVVIPVTQAKYAAPTGTFELFSGDLVEGDYVFVVDAKAMTNSVPSDKLSNTDVTPSENVITNPDASIIWHIAASGDYWTIYNAAVEKYAASTGTKNKAQMLDDGTDDKAKWSVAKTGNAFNFQNKANADGSVNAKLQRNGDYGWACYANYSDISLYKKQVAGQPKAPTFSVEGGNYESAQSVELSCETEGATIYYTTNGDAPTISSTQYNGTAIAVDHTMTIKAIAIKNEISSTVASATYTIIVWQTVADVWDDITADGPKNAHIYGYVSQVNVGGYDNNFYISDNGSTEGNQLYAYRMNMNSFSVAVGDKVKLAGDLTIYQGTKEFKYTSDTECGKVVSLTAKGALTTVAVSGTPTKTEYASGEEFKPAGLKVFGTYANGFVGEITEGIEWRNDLTDTDGKVTENTTVHVTATVGGVTSDAYGVAIEVSTKALVSIALSANEFEVYQGLELPKPIVTATYSEGEPEDVTDWAEFTGYDKTTPGEQTITVSYSFGGNDDSKTYTVIVKPIYNVELAASVAKTLIETAVGETESTEDMIVRGIVSYINDASKNVQTYWISDDGTRTNEVEIYKGKYLSDANFTTTNQLKVGDEVVVKGKVVYYNSTTPEFASGKSQLLSLARTPNFEIEAVTGFEVGSPDLAVADLTITQDGEGAITLSIDPADAEKATIVSNAIHAVGAGTVTVTANLAADGIYKAATTTFSVTVIPAQVKYAITFDGNGANGGEDPEAIADKAAGVEVTLPANTWTKEGFTFTGWKVFNYSTSAEVEVVAGAFEMPASAVTIQAQWAEIPVWAYTYSSNITVGTDIVKFSDEPEAPEYAAKKTGTSSAYGSTTVTVPVSTSKLHFHAVCYGGDTYAVTLKVKKGDNVLGTFNIKKDDGAKSSSPFTLKNTPYEQYYSVTLTDITEPTTITFEADKSGSENGKRFIIFGVNQEGGLVPVLDHIEIAGDLTTKSGYKAGDDLDLDGLTVSATYTLGGTPQTPVDITNDAELAWSYDPLVENQTSVTITATYKGQTDDIEITGLEPVASADPLIITDPTTYLNWGTIIKDATAPTKTITVTLQNVTAATAALGGTNPTAFTIDDTEIADGDVITVSVTSTATEGTYSAKVILTDNAGHATDKEINLSLTIEDAEAAVSTTSKWVAATEADLVDGAEVLITGVKSEVTYAMSVKSSNGNNRTSVAGTLDEGVFTPGENTMSFFLEANGENFYIKTSNGKYLYNASSSGSSYLKTKDDSEDASWTITIDGDNNAVITSVENTNRTLMRFNLNGTSNPLFNCYASGQQPVKLYVPQPVTPPTPALTEVRTGLTAGNYYTMCLEKAVTDVHGGSIWRVLSKAQNTSDIILEEVDGTLDAGRPYIFFATADKLEVVYEGAAVGAPITMGNNGLVGSFEKELIAPVATNYIIYNNALYFVNSDNVYVGAHRAYLDMTGVPPYSNEPQQGNAPRRRVTMAVHGEQVATGMENVQGDNVQCTKVLINGQLFIIRGEKMYDAKGQLVK